MATATAEPRSVPATEGDGHKHKKNALSDGQGRLAWILLAPTLIIIAVVAGIPVVMSIREAFFQTNTGVDPNTGLIAGGEQFVGLQNFTNIFAGQNPVPGNFGTMDRFWNAFLNTTFITIVCVLLETILGVAMALIMAKAFRGRGIVRAGILVPWAIPTIVSASRRVSSRSASERSVPRCSRSWCSSRYCMKSRIPTGHDYICSGS